MKKTIILICWLILLICACGCSMIRTFLRENDDYFINLDCVYYDEDEMEALFYEYREDFEKVAEIVLSNDEHLKYIQENDDREILDARKKGFFTDDEWEIICRTLKETKMEGIIRRQVGKEGEGSICFKTIILKDKPIVDLCYVSNENYKPYISDATFKRITEGWYIVKRSQIQL